jgi:hypothetical protein
MLLLTAFATCLLAGIAAAGCGGGGEEQALVRNYFTATRVNDRTTLGNIATVQFDPQEDGVVTAPNVVSVTPEERRPLRTKELMAALRQARDAETEFNTRKREYQDANIEAINRVIEAERANQQIAARDRAVQEAWNKWREETMQHTKMISGAEAELNAERRVPAASVFNPENPLDVAQFDGELISKDVTVEANVTRGETEEQRTLTVTMERAILTGADGQSVEGRWIITNIS